MISWGRQEIIGVVSIGQDQVGMYLKHWMYILVIVNCDGLEIIVCTEVFFLRR